MLDRDYDALMVGQSLTLAVVTSPHALRKLVTLQQLALDRIVERIPFIGFRGLLSNRHVFGAQISILRL